MFAFILTRFAHIYKKGLAYRYKKPTTHNYGKILRQTVKANSCGKFRQIATASSHGNFLEYMTQKMVCNNPLCGRLAYMVIK